MLGLLGMTITVFFPLALEYISKNNERFGFSEEIQNYIWKKLNPKKWLIIGVCFWGILA